MDTIPGTNFALPKPGTPEHDLYAKYTPEQYLRAAQAQKTLWYERCNEAVIAARQRGEKPEDVWPAEFAEVMKLMDEFYNGSTDGAVTTDD